MIHSHFSYDTPREFDFGIDVQSILKDRKFALQFDAMEYHTGSQDSIEDVRTTKRLNKKVNDQLVIIPPAPRQPEILKYKTEQKYEGTVTQVNNSDGVFTARLVDLSGNGPDEEGEFSLNELNGDDSLVMPGASFTWVIGMQTRGTRDQRVSEIRFRRIPPHSKELIQNAELKANELSQFFSRNRSEEPLELHI